MAGEMAEMLRLKATAKMPQDELYRRIVRFLKEQTMCVLATSSNDVPRATPVEYYSNGTTLYVLADIGVKTENLKVNPRISVGIFSMVHPIWTNGKDWLACKSAQVTGLGKILLNDDSEYAEALKHYKWQIFFEALGRDTSQPPKGRPIIKVEAQKVEYMEFALKREGFTSKQTWVAPV